MKGRSGFIVVVQNGVFVGRVIRLRGDGYHSPGEVLRPGESAEGKRDRRD